MTARRTFSLTAPLLLLLPWSLSAQQHPAVRDAFWSASDLISVAPNPASHRHSASHARSHSPSANEAASAAPNRADAAASSATPAAKMQLVSDNGYGAAPHLVRTAENRLGLRCSLLLRDAEGQYAEVAPGTVFHSGDHIRLSLLANEPGYFYVIQQGSTGAWSPIFPAPNSAPDANRIPAGQPQLVPGGTQSFAFDQNPGDEKLFVILSRTPIDDIDRVIRNLKGDRPATMPSPSSDAPATLIAENKIPDIFVQQLASRDLTLVDEQKVDDSSSAGEKAIYVVSKSGTPDAGSRVVLNLDLRHQ